MARRVTYDLHRSNDGDLIEIKTNIMYASEAREAALSFLRNKGMAGVQLTIFDDGEITTIKANEVTLQITEHDA